MKPGDSASVSVARLMWTYDDDMTSASGENWKEPSSLAILTDSSFNGDNNEETRKIVLQKILEKVFVNKKFTQCKTPRTLKPDVFEIPDNKNWKIVFKIWTAFLEPS